MLNALWATSQRECMSVPRPGLQRPCGAVVAAGDLKTA